MADFNSDGKPDILSSDGTLELGNGNGAFNTGKNVGPNMAAVADFNGDGKPDAVQYGSASFAVVLGNGDGTFQKPITTYTGATVYSLSAGDLNGDGKADIVAVTGTGNTVLVYLSNGDGTFANGVIYNLNFGQDFFVSMTLGDVNGDSKLDIVVTTFNENGPGHIFVLLGNGDGTFQTNPIISTGSTNSPVFGDFNGDGKTDLAGSSSGGVYILFGNGDGSLQPPSLVIPGNGGQLAAADLTGQNKLDLITYSFPIVQVYLNDGHANFSVELSYLTVFSDTYSGIVVADFNLDGKPDVAADNTVFLGNGDGTFKGQQIALLPATPNAAAAGDFDNKGNQDVAAITGTDLYVLLNDGTGILSLAHTYPISGTAIATADFNADGNLDLLVAGSGGYNLLLGNGDGSFQAPISDTLEGGGTGQIVVGDFNNDHKLDFTVNLENLAALLGNGDGSFAAPVYYSDGTGQTNIMAADFNGDGNIDIAVGLTTETALLFGNGDGTFKAADFSLGNFAAVATADFNHDGKADLAGGGGNGWQILLGHGNGTFNPLSKQSFPGFGGYLYPLTPDLNSDGTPDMMASAQTGSEGWSGGVFLGNGDGTFGVFTYIPQLFAIGNEGSQTPLQVADMNQDGQIDLIVSMNTVSGGPVTSGIFALLNTTKTSQGKIGIGIPIGGSNSQTVAAGNKATYTLTIGGMGWGGQATLTCSGAPQGASCSFPAGASMTVEKFTASQFKVTVSTTARSMAAVMPASHLRAPWLWTMALMGVVLVPGSIQGKRMARNLSLLTVCSLLLVLGGCGGGSGGSSGSQTSSGTPVGNYTLTVTASAGTLQETTPLTLIVQ